MRKGEDLLMHSQTWVTILSRLLKAERLALDVYIRLVKIKVL
jgi:hypothetical protein